MLCSNEPQSSIVSAFEQVVGEKNKKNSVQEMYRLREQNGLLERVNTQLTAKNQRLVAQLEMMSDATKGIEAENSQQRAAVAAYEVYDCKQH